MKFSYSEIFHPTPAKRKISFLVFDIIIFTLSFTFAILIKNDFEFPIYFQYNYPIILALVVLLKLFVFGVYNLYDVVWRFVSIQELYALLKANLISSLLLFTLFFGTEISAFQGMSKSTVIIDFILAFLLSSGTKLSKRFVSEILKKNLNYNYIDLKRTFIIGAGHTGEQILREINRRYRNKYYPIGFIDDDKQKLNLYIQGIRVLGTIDDLKNLIKMYHIDCILIAIASADRKLHMRILHLAREEGVEDIKIVSRILDASESISIGMKDLKDLEVTDLIGRQAVSINTNDISKFISNKRVLITGAAGSIGSEIAKQVCHYFPSKLGILDINESDLSDLELLLNYETDSQYIHSYLCDISDRSHLEYVFSKFKPDIVFHAAAYKHVPIMEKFPNEAVRVNILGTYNLVKMANQYGTKNFVLISTDKAVNPTSIMGVTKRIAEIIVTDGNTIEDGRYLAVRFGNVIGSRGSVLPIFMEQIRRGGPVTITHPDMRRYFMTIPEAVALVLQAGTIGSRGEVFVLDMGDPIRITDLAKELIRLHNLKPDKDIKLSYTGIREGEKLFEEFLTAEEGVDSTNYKKIFRARMNRKMSFADIEEMIAIFSQFKSDRKSDWQMLFKRFVPSYASIPADNLIYLAENKNLSIKTQSASKN